MLDHLPCGDVALTLISWVWRALIRKVERVVELLGRKTLVRRRDNNIAIAHLLDECCLTLHHVA